MRFPAVAFAGLFGALVASVAASQFTLEARTVDPAGWVKGARVSASRVLPFKVALKQQNLEKFDDMFWAISTPGSYVSRDISYQCYLKIEVLCVAVAVIVLVCVFSVCLFVSSRSEGACLRARLQAIVRPVHDDRGSQCHDWHISF